MGRQISFNTASGKRHIINEIYLNPVSTIDGSFTGTVVVHVNQGDDMLIRTGSVSNKGDIISDFGG